MSLQALLGSKGDENLRVLIMEVPLSAEGAVEVHYPVALTWSRVLLGDLSHKHDRARRSRDEA